MSASYEADSRLMGGGFMGADTMRGRLEMAVAEAMMVRGKIYIQ